MGRTNRKKQPLTEREKLVLFDHRIEELERLERIEAELSQPSKHKEGER